jgi:predicted ATP-dependent endonuclease of OLD family
MHISCVEIQNFRKLRAVRVDFHPERTLLVGPNNSGKTSAMLCLGHFLVKDKRFNPNDFTLCNWKALNHIGEKWCQRHAAQQPIDPQLSDFEALLPSLDLWLEVQFDEVYLVRPIMPTLSWSGGLIGVRLRYEPDVKKLAQEYVLAVTEARKVKASSPASTSINIWPESLRDFLDRHLHRMFSVVAYSLDPSRQRQPDPDSGAAIPQPLPPGSEPIKGNPLKGILKVNEIAADRGFGGAGSLPSGDRDGDTSARDRRTLSAQLRTYYADHLDPTEYPEAQDLEALVAIKASEKQFDGHLKARFSLPLQELQKIGYPGPVDPSVVVSTELTALNALQHKAAVQFQIASDQEEAIARQLRLPEDYNGLGYQNLIYIVFQLMRFRDAWLQVGKVSKRAESQDDVGIPPVHVVLIEEPEAHLHAQVQQVFIREAYSVLRNHKDLGTNPALRTQLVVSTHSSHVTHECEFNCLRYFRRRPGKTAGDTPYSTVINLTQTFGPDEDTPRFVERYLTSMHSDLFFADAAIFVEGSAEGILVPHFIRDDQFEDLRRSYITILEIGGSHAHRLKPLVEHLGLTTLVVTDLDAVDTAGEKTPAAVGQEQVTTNPTLKDWHPKKPSVDDLLKLSESDKTLRYSDLFAVRVAYQFPEAVSFKETPATLSARTFEDALIFKNLEFFRQSKETTGAIAKFRQIITECTTATELPDIIFTELKRVTKAAFALDLLFCANIKSLQIPAYLSHGLHWLQSELKRKQSGNFTSPLKDVAKED